MLGKIEEMLQAGKTWQEIANACDFKSRQAAQQWYGRAVKKPRLQTLATLAKFTGIDRRRLQEIINDEDLGFADENLVAKIHDYILNHKCERCKKLLPKGRSKFCCVECEAWKG